jgi:arginine decarboxylase
VERTSGRKALSWTVADSARLYNVNNWGAGFFSVNRKGNVCVHPAPRSRTSIELAALIDDLIAQNINPPILLRFMNILEGRIESINSAFRKAIRANDYPAGYQTFYPIKVNQQRQVVEAIAGFGKRYRLGLEIGSKPELLAAISLSSGQGLPIICNGYKDNEFIETVLYANRIGYDITIVVEKLFELEKIIALSQQHRCSPKLGLRVKLSTRGSGRWATSSGQDAKFGLAASELVTAIEILRQHGLLECVKLLHFHIGSQITKIEKIKKALIEGVRTYAELRKIGVNLEYLDIGGGLGVDYDGSKSSFFSSVNYSLDEYASDIVYQIKNVCDAARVPCPNIISESGRATVAHYSMLVTNLLHTDTQHLMPEPHVFQTRSSTVQKLIDIHKSIDQYSLREDYHDTIQLIQETTSLFNLGYLDLLERANAESVYRSILKKIHRLLDSIDPVPEELRNFQVNLRQAHFANFSLFQSLPDSWAIDQLFPIMPLQRLNERPEVISTIADLTCDSDGEISGFVGESGKSDFLAIHRIASRENYYLGFFMIGAYQEILGDLHNLFGDTNAVHISFGKKSSYQIDTVIKGDNISSALKYVQYDLDEMVRQVRSNLEEGVAARKISREESLHFLERLEKAFQGYTYLGRDV